MRFSPLFSGSSGNCSLVSAGGVDLLVDAGMTGRAIVGALNEVGLDPAKLAAIVVTHEHSDHVKSIGVLSRKYDIPVYANEGTWRAMSPLIGDVAMKNIRTFITGQNFYIGDIDVTPSPLSHDAAEPVGDELRAHCAALPGQVEEQMDKLQFSQALTEIWKVIGECNKYIDQTQPWVLGKDPEKKGLLGNVLRTLAECVRFVAVLIGPVMPSTPEKIFAQLGVTDGSLKTWDSLGCFGALPEGLKVCKGDALFPRLDIKKELEALAGEDEKAEKAEQKAQKKEEKQEKKQEKKEAKKPAVPEGCIAFDDFEKIQMKVARVLTCEKVAKSDKLLQFRLSLGEEERTVLSGIAKFYSPEELVGKKLILLANLAPRKIMGIESQGMLLSAVKENEDGSETLRLLMADPIIPDGAIIG